MKVTSMAGMQMDVEPPNTTEVDRILSDEDEGGGLTAPVRAVNESNSTDADKDPDSNEGAMALLEHLLKKKEREKYLKSLPKQSLVRRTLEAYKISIEAGFEEDKSIDEKASEIKSHKQSA